MKILLRITIVLAVIIIGTVAFKVGYSHYTWHNLEQAQTGVFTKPPATLPPTTTTEPTTQASADTELVGRQNYRLNLLSQQSARCISGYVFSSCGFGESTQDAVYGGSGFIFENGEMIALGERFAFTEQLIISEIDVEMLKSERRRNSLFSSRNADNISAVDINCQPTVLAEHAVLTRTIDPHPFSPQNTFMDIRYEEIFNIQVAGLAKRILHTNAKTLIVGISGGLDSTLALLVCAKTIDKLKRERKTRKVLMFVFIMRMDTSSLSEVVGRYQDNAYIGGFLAGYDTMDTLAALVFGLVVANTLQRFNLTESQTQKMTIAAGMTAGLFLGLIYWLLTSIGHATSAQFPNTANGAEILLESTVLAIGQPGAILLTLIFSLACLNTCVGLLTSLSEYFTLLFPRISYKGYLAIFVVWSFVTANFGLDAILKISVPILIFIYPAAIVLIVMELTRQWFNYSRKTYQLIIYTVAAIGAVTALESAKIMIPGLTLIFRNYLPLYKQQLGWLMPFIILLVVCTLFDYVKNGRNKTV